MGFVGYCLRTRGPVETITKGLAALAGAYIGWKMGGDAVFAAEYTARFSALDYAINESPLVTKLTIATLAAATSGFVGKLPGRAIDYLHSNSRSIMGQ